MSAYLDGELASSGRLRLEHHVRECEQCRRLLGGLRGLLDSLHRLPVLSEGTQARQIAASVRIRLAEPPGPE